jgi:hypothetical protein
MLTLNEAIERANQLWPGRPMSVCLRGIDGGADVLLLPTARERTTNYHRLDGNGHPVCHEACSAAEAAR